MNEIHDLGGMHGMGAVWVEAGEPVFHAEWEGRVFAICWATFITYFPVDETRAAIERIPPGEYLGSSYYQRWLRGLEMLLVEHRHVAPDELDIERPSPLAHDLNPSSMTLPMMERFVYPGVSCAASVPVEPRFREGDRVVVRVAHPETYTRSPRYVRGRQGVIFRDHGAFAFPDTMGQRLGEHPQHVYAVRFTARELWGSTAPERDALHIDLYDDHLGPAF